MLGLVKALPPQLGKICCERIMFELTSLRCAAIPTEHPQPNPNNTNTSPSRKLAINNFWTKNPRGLLGSGSRGSRQITMGVKTITRLPKMIGELFFGFSGNNYLYDYLPKIPGELFFGPFR